MAEYNYFPILKTTDAELRAYIELPEPPILEKYSRSDSFCNWAKTKKIRFLLGGAIFSKFNLFNALIVYIAVPLLWIGMVLL